MAVHEIRKSIFRFSSDRSGRWSLLGVLEGGAKKALKRITLSCRAGGRAAEACRSSFACSFRRGTSAMGKTTERP